MKTMSGAALVAAAPGSLWASPQNPRPKAVVFWEPEFPQVNGCDVTQELLREALFSFDVAYLSEPDLRKRLNTESFDLLVTPHGSAFPKKSWPTILEYLRKGGNWLNLGGAPFVTPVVRAGSRWEVETNQSAYHKRLGITQWFPVAGTGIASYRNVDPKLKALTSVRQVFETYVRFSSTSDTPGESGSDGPREAVLTSLVFGINKQSRPIAAPIIQIDRTQGDFAGGRWVLANFSGTIDASTIRSLAERAAESAMQLIVRSDFACYRDGETPLFTVELSRIRKFVWSPLPVEVTESIEATVAFYRFALGQARFVPVFRVVPDTPGMLVVPSVFADHVLYSFVSETDRDVSLRLFHKEVRSSATVVVKGERTAFVLMDRKTGKVIDSTK